MRKAWEGDDRLRPLSDRGLAQAKSLAKKLAPYEPVRILTSPAVRCRQTVEPLADAFSLDVTDDDRLFEGPTRRAVSSLVDDAERKMTLVFCSHGDVIPALLHELIDRGMTHDDRLIWQKSSTWTVEYSKKHGWGAAHYVTPPRGR